MVFTIGQFSKICRVTTKTLRHYDEVDLLKPARVDPLTGYRYYAVEQIDEFSRIALLKELGFGLEAIKHLLKQPLDAAELAAVLKDQAEHIRQRVDEYQRVLARITKEIDSLQRGKNILRANQVNEPQIKELPAVRAASIRDRVPYSKVGELFGELLGFINLHKLTVNGSGIFIHHDPEYRPEGADLEVCLPVAGEAPGSGRVSIKELPACRAVCLLHVGPYDQVGSTYAGILQYIAEKQLTITGSSREVYLVGPVGVPPEKYVTEVQFPVA
ncbi:MAG: MerR family transcriptional regulator [Armatimonadetes bacterium]|nr:MerR family transcriptional regulator [Armatimonadota bacterium]